MNELIDTLQKEVLVTPAEVPLILARFTQRKYRRGDTLLRAGDVPDAVFFVLKGVLHQFYSEENGAEHSCNFTVECEFVTDLAAFQNRTASPSSIQALTDVTVLCATYHDLAGLVTTSAAVAEYFRIVVERIAGEGIKRTKSLLASSPETRFIELARERPDLLQRIPQRYLAQYLGIAPESLSRIKKRLMVSEKS